MEGRWYCTARLGSLGHKKKAQRIDCVLIDIYTIYSDNMEIDTNVKVVLNR